MTQQPVALLLAEKLEQQFPVGTAQHYLDGEAAAELRRLHREVEEISSENMMLGNHNKNLHDHVEQLRRMLEQLRAVNAQLLEALGEIEWSNNSRWQADRARAAIVAAKGEA